MHRHIILKGRRLLGHPLPSLPQPSSRIAFLSTKSVAPDQPSNAIKESLTDNNSDILDHSLLGQHTVTFGDIGIRPQIVKLLESQLGVVSPTQNQRNVIPTILSGSDVLLRDETGSGKTLGLVMAALSKSVPASIVDRHGEESKKGTKKYVQSLILVPTRDLALQITDWICTLSSFSNPKEDMAGTVQCLVSGVDPELQKALLSKTPPKFIVGTPVRTLELFESNHFDISRLQLLVLDEVDRLLAVSQKYASVSKKWQAIAHVPAGQTLLDKIVKYRRQISFENSKIQLSDPAKKTRLQVVICSATLNSSLRSLVKRSEWTRDAVYLDVIGKPQSPKTLIHEGHVVTPKGLFPLDWHPTAILPKTGAANENNTESLASTAAVLPSHLHGIDLEHTYGDVDPKVLEALPLLIAKHSLKSGFIFANAAVSVRSLVASLKELGLDAARLMDVTDYTLESMGGSEASKKKRLPDWIVLTEHEARGLDLPGRSGVFILGLPSTAASYLHMSGRAGRAGQKGRAVTLLGGYRYGLRFERMMRLAGVTPSSPTGNGVDG